MEEPATVDFAFDIWNKEFSCWIRLGFKRFNQVGIEVLVILADGVKQQRVGDSGVGLDDTPMAKFDVIVVDAAILGDLKNGSFSEVASSFFEVVICTTPSKECNPDLKSILVLKDVIKWYMRAMDKLRSDLKQISLDYHAWTLKSWNHEGMGVVKNFYAECKKDFGGMIGDHKANNVQNLFANFKKSHLMCNGHVQNWCRRKGTRFAEHLYSALREKPVAMTAEDHRHAVHEGLKIMMDANGDEGLAQPSFEVVGDLDNVELKSIWFRVKCRYCRDFLLLCPP